MPGKPSSSSPIPSSPDARRGLPRPRRATSPAPTFLPVQPSHTSDASVLLPRMRRSLRAVACCRIWGGGRGTPPPARAGFPFPPKPPSPPLRAFVEEDERRRDTQAPLRPPVPRRYKRKAFPAAEKQPLSSGKKRKPLPVRKERTRRGKSPCRERNSPLVRAWSGKNHHPSEPGRGGDPRNAGAQQQARISPAKREDARRPAPCGERRTRYTTGDSDARRHTDKGV